MSLRLVLTADTHLPGRARDLPEPLWAAIDTADVVVHAGDWVTVDLLDALEARAARLVGVHGNNDGPALRARLPEVARMGLGGVPTDRRRQPTCSWMTAEVGDGRLGAVSLHHLPPRT